MKDFLRHLRAAYRFARLVRHIPEADDPIFWTEADASYTANFLKSYTGKKLLMRLDNYAYKSALAAVRQKGSEAYECGEAAGIQLGIIAFQAHTISQVAAHSDKSETEESEVMASDLEAQMT